MSNAEPVPLRCRDALHSGRHPPLLLFSRRINCTIQFMNLQKFTVKAQKAVQKATELAASDNHQGIEPPHLLEAFLSDPDSVAVSILRRVGANINRLREQVETAMASLPTVTGASASDQYVGEELKKVFDRARAEADVMDDEYVSTEHLLIGLVETYSSSITSALARARSNTFFNSSPTYWSPALAPVTVGSDAMAVSTCSRRRSTFAPTRRRIDTATLSGSLRNASSRCGGSMP